MYKFTVEIFKDIYYHEQVVKESLNSRISVPLGALSIIATLAIYFATVIEKSPSFFEASFMICLFYIITFFIIILTLWALIILLILLYGFKYNQYPNPKDIDDYIAKLEYECEKRCYPEDEKEVRLETELDDYWYVTYKDASIKNYNNNIEKNDKLRHANIIIIIALILCVINVIPLCLYK